ncbi:MAG TPA: endonuclease/exonuclease/phosphatase family protein [Dehalococcoidia bacterium]|nr:endonuclease/exonuclease/phosphatase family protein [Dehalococcoidia bacterium]
MPVPTDTPQEAQERLDLMKLMDEGPYKVPNRRVDENLILGTWNIQQFSEKKTWRALKYMADIIERFDIIAIQELKSNLVGLGRLQEILPGQYRILVSDVTGNTERFAFVYDQRTVQATGLVAEIGLPISTVEHEGFQIHRMPYCASFSAGRFDFTVVSVHIFESNLTFREREIDVLAKHLTTMSRRERTKVVDRDFFVVGDFNIVKEGDRFFNALAAAGFKMPAKLNSLTTNFKRTGTYDKIAWVDRPGFEFSDKCNVVPFYHAVFQDAVPPGGLEEISDHLPLWAEFYVNKLTQQLEQVLNR